MFDLENKIWGIFLKRKQKEKPNTDHTTQYTDTDTRTTSDADPACFNPVHGMQQIHKPHMATAATLRCMRHNEGTAAARTLSRLCDINYCASLQIPNPNIYATIF